MIRPVARFIDTLNLKIGHVIAWLTLGMVLLTFLNVIQRYFFQSNNIWQSELVIYMHAIVFMLGAGYTLKREAHVRVDVFYQHFCARTRGWVDLLGTLFFLFPVCIGLLYFSYDFVISAWRIEEASAEYDGLACVYLLKTCIWGYALTLFLQGVAIILRSILAIQGKEGGALG
jgi:TRAP-type mannitol/chloroaromatic compound transport system permease small subunit